MPYCGEASSVRNKRLFCWAGGGAGGGLYNLITL